MTDQAAAAPKPTVAEASAATAATSSNQMIWLLSLVVTISLVVITVLFMFHEMPDKNHDIILILVTAFTTGWVTIVGYHFGSSAANKVKDVTISQLSK